MSVAGLASRLGRRGTQGCQILHLNAVPVNAGSLIMAWRRLEKARSNIARDGRDPGKYSF